MSKGFFSSRITHASDAPQPDSMQINFASKSVGAYLNTYWFEDHGYVVTYIPSLQLSAYGSTQQEAYEMLTAVVLDDFCNTIIDMPEFAVFEELSKLGWSSTRVDQTRVFKSDSYVDEEGVLRNFDLPQDTPVHRQLLSV